MHTLSKHFLNLTVLNCTRSNDYFSFKLFFLFLLAVVEIQRKRNREKIDGKLLFLQFKGNCFFFLSVLSSVLTCFNKDNFLFHRKS